MGVGAAALIVVVVVGITVMITMLGGGQDWRRRQALAGAFGGTVTQGGIALAWNGVPVQVRFTSLAGKQPTYWTYVEAALPARYAFELHVRAHTYDDQTQIARGMMVDVAVGVPAFDAAFLVEGAPAVVVRRVLTPQVCAAMMGAPPLKLDTASGVLQLVVNGWHEDALALRPWIETVATIAGGIRTAHAEADQAVPLATEGGAYREIADDRPLQDARAARVEEVARLGALRRARHDERLLEVVIYVGVILGALGLVVVLFSEC